MENSSAGSGSTSLRVDHRLCQFLRRTCENSEMAGKDDYRIFVGGLAWDVTERQLERTFGRFGKVIECQVRTLAPVVERLWLGFKILFMFVLSGISNN